MSSPSKTRSRSILAKVAAAALVEEEVVASRNQNVPVVIAVTSESRAETVVTALRLIGEGMSIRKASRECGITRQLIRALVLHSALHFLISVFAV